MSKKNSQHTRKKKGPVTAEIAFFMKDVQKPIIVRRKLTFITQDAAATGAQLSYSLDSSTITSCVEWANLSPNYQQYRIRAIRVRLVPKQFSNMNSAALIWYPGAIVSGSFPAGSSASTPNAVFSEDGSKVHLPWVIAEHTVTWNSNPDAKLWTDCNAGAPAVLSRFGLQFRGSEVAPLAYNGLNTHDVFVEYDTEFLGRN